MSERKRILLVHLGAYGDCMMATTIVRQIKNDFPGSHLTWCIADKYASVIKNNPDVDAVWEFPVRPGEEITLGAWERCQVEVNKRRDAGEFDLVFSTQVYPDNAANFDGTTRSSTFRNYPHPITVPIKPVVRLLPEEIAKVQTFAEEHRLSSYRHVVLMECSPGSGQSAFNLEAGLELANRLTRAKESLVVILTTHQPFVSPHNRILVGNVISYRENAALTHYCTLLVGCSSGVSWLGTSDASKQLSTVQFLGRNLGASFASMAYDFEYFGLSTDHILEHSTSNVDTMTTIVLEALDDFGKARLRHHQALRPIFWSWLCFIDHRRGFRGVMGSYRTLFHFIRRNGVKVTELFDFVSLGRALSGHIRKSGEKLLGLVRRSPRRRKR